MPKQSPAQKRGTLIRAVLSAVLLVAAGYLLAAHWQTVHSGLDIARGASIGWLGLSLLLMALTFLIAAGIYGVLALHPLRFRQTVLVEVSTAFVNRLLPSGLGGLGLHGVYLYKRGHSAAEATVVVSANNLIGMLAHLLLLALVVAAKPSIFHDLFARHHFTLPWQAFVGVGAGLVALLLIPAVRARLLRFGKNLLASVGKLRLASVVQALGLAALLTCTYTLILLGAARSIGIMLGVLQIFIIFSIGMLFSTATPTPGGLVGAEAGLFAGFVAYGVAAPTAAAAVVLYRLISYWLPLIPGVLCLFWARRRKLV